MPNNYNKISSKDNPKFKHVRHLLDNANYRKKSQQTVLEGIHLLQAYLQTNNSPVQIWLSSSAVEHAEVVPFLNSVQNCPIFTLPNQLYKQIRSVGNGVDILAVIDVPTHTLPKISSDVLILNEVQDIGNVGTLIRTAAAIGIPNILCSAGTANVWSPKCLRAGMGAQFAITIYENLAIENILTQVTTPMFATSSHTDKILYTQDLTQPIAWIMGNEGQGVCEQLMQKANKVALPQPNGQESLNVAIAGSVCLYEMLRQRAFTTSC